MHGLVTHVMGGRLTLQSKAFQLTWSGQGLQLAGEAQQHLAGLGQPQGAGAHHQRLADLGLQRSQPLGDGTLGDGQALGGALKAPLFHDGGQAFEGV